METNPEIKKIEIPEESLKDLDKTRKWSMFLAILGFIGTGLMIIGSIIAVLFLSVFKTKSAFGISESLFIIILIAIAALYLFPLQYLYMFSRHTATAVKMLDGQEMQKAFKFLKRYYVFMGILVIVILALYAVGIVVAGASLSFLKDMGSAM